LAGLDGLMCLCQPADAVYAAGMDEEALAAKFVQDLDAVAAGLVGEFGLRWQQTALKTDPNSAMQRWLDFRFRYVEPRKRNLLFSDKFPKALAPLASAELAVFAQASMNGDDLNPRQGRSLTEFHDTSGELASRRTEALWADWGIHHFHLSSAPLPSSAYHTARAPYLAICVVAEDLLGVIDVIPHPKGTGWATPDFLETVYRSWPDSLRPFRVAETTPAPPKTKEEIHTLRKKALNHTTTIDGAAYLGPGLGVMTSNTSVKARIAADHAMEAARVLARFATLPDGPILRELTDQAVTTPDFRLLVHKGTLGIGEFLTSTFFSLSQEKPGQIAAAMQTIYNVVLPDWALRRLPS
jgi:hypothetical protein